MEDSWPTSFTSEYLNRLDTYLHPGSRHPMHDLAKQTKNNRRLPQGGQHSFTHTNMKLANPWYLFVQEKKRFAYYPWRIVACPSVCISTNSSLVSFKTFEVIIVGFFFHSQRVANNFVHVCRMIHFIADRGHRGENITRGTNETEVIWLCYTQVKSK